ncbi:hypothetical protein [Planotetraspora sp. GP83]|uniref:hypothetical protein n=1 Tax=Planotetraspora sp. GP83 TaxID=3156264 RepID=UPI003515E20D
MIEVSLLEVLRSGRFGPIALGDSRTRLRHLLGNPDAYAITPSEDPRFEGIWLYGDLEFHFYDETDTVWMIYTDSFDVPSGGDAIGLDPWVLRWDMPIAEVRAALDDAGVGWEPNPSPPPDVESIQTIGDVQLGFPTGEGLQMISLYRGYPYRAP